MSGILIIGASHSGIAAAAALRSAGHEGAITIIGGERHLPYHRPSLSKEGFAGGDFSPPLLRPESFYEKNGIHLVLGQPIAALYPQERYALGSDGRRHDYSALILACGAAPRRLPTSVDPQGAALYLRSYDDFLGLKARFSTARSAAIIGGGLIGLEVAAMAAANGVRTTLIEASERLMERTVSKSLSNYLLDRHLANGMDIRLRTTVSSVAQESGHDVIRLDNDQSIEADVTIAAIGVFPNDKLAREAGLAAGNGVLVTEQGMTSDPAIYAVGDCSAWFDPTLGRYVRCEAVNPGQDQAKIVAAAILGKVSPPKRFPRYWSHQAAIQLQMAGDIQSPDMEAVLKAPASGAFSVLGFREGRLAGIQSVNAAPQFSKLHELIGMEREALAAALDVEFPPPRH